MVRSVRRRESVKGDTPADHGKRRKKRSSHPNNPFLSLLNESGFHLAGSAEEPNELSTDQIVLQQKLAINLKKDKKIVDCIGDALEELWSDHYRFCFSLLPSNTSDDCSTSSRGKQQESLIRILLGIDVLQPVVICLLLEKLPEVSMDDELTSVALKLGDLDLIHKIVSQLKWLDHIVNSKDLLDKIFEVISVTESNIQQELIAIIPDLIDDNNTEDIANKLRQLLLDNSHLVPFILDAFSNLNLKGDLLDQIRDSVLQILSSANLTDLPLIVKFLQHSATHQNALEIINDLREKLDFNTTAPPQIASTPFQQKKKQPKKDNQEVLIFEAIKSGLRFHKFLGDMWMTTEEGINNAVEQKILDVYVLLVLYSAKNRRKTVETLMRNKIKAGIFTEENLTTAFQSYPQVFSDFLQEIVLMAEVYLRSPEVSISNYGCNIYKQAFCGFDTYAQQEVIGALVTHIGSGFGPEVEASFLVLKTLVDKETTKMTRFIIFLKGILDYIDKLSISQMRSLFSMISKLTYDTSAMENVSDDDMYVLLRKQLSHPVLKYKRIGVVGAMMITANIGKKRAESLDNTTLPNACYDQVISLLTLVQKSVKTKPESLALFYDELGSIVEKENLDEKILNWIAESVISDFQEEYLIDADVIKTSNEKNLQLAFDLDEPEEGGICVNILPVILSGVQNKQQAAGGSNSSCVTTKNKLLALAAQFRLVRICEQQQNNGSLEGIDALLGCPLVLYTDEITQQMLTMNSQDRIILCTSLIHAINWIRECLNAFCSEGVDTDTRGKIISRIKTLVKLNSTLEKCLAITKNFEMPVADFSVDDNLLAGVKSLKSVLEAKHFKKPKKTVRNKKKAGTNTITTATTITDETEIEQRSSDKDEDELENEEKAMDGTFSLMQFPASFRELDLPVFFSLAYGSVNKAYLDSEMHTKAREEIKLDACELTFLLTDLSRKLEHVFSGSNKRSFLKKSVTKLIGFSHLPNDKEVVKFMLKLLSSLSDVLQQCHKYFKDINEKNDGIVDCNAMRTEECKHYIALYKCVLDVLLHNFQWDGFKKASNKKLLRLFFSTFTQRTSPTQNDNLVSHICELISQPVDYVPDVQVAVKITKLLLVLSKHEENVVTKIKELLEKYLQHTWINKEGEKEKGSAFNDSYSFLMTQYINTSAVSLDTIHELLHGPVAELVENNNNGDDGTEKYPAITKNYFPSLYRCLFNELVSHVKTKMNLSSKKNDTEEVIVTRLETIQKSVKIFQAMISTVKEMDVRNILITSLKYSRLYLELFLKCIMPVLDKTLRTHKVKLLNVMIRRKKNLVHLILKSAQQSTRALQHLCGHSKISKDVSMTTYVPALKKCLETFVFRVKAMLAFNHCDSAFWLGNLKNRDLRGNEILSQASQDTTQDSSALMCEDDLLNISFKDIYGDPQEKNGGHQTDASETTRDNDDDDDDDDETNEDDDDDETEECSESF